MLQSQQFFSYEDFFFFPLIILTSAQALEHVDTKATGNVCLHFRSDFWCLQTSVSGCCSHSCKALRLIKHWTRVCPCIIGVEQSLVWGCSVNTQRPIWQTPSCSPQEKNGRLFITLWHVVNMTVGSIHLTGNEHSGFFFFLLNYHRLLGGKKTHNQKMTHCGYFQMKRSLRFQNKAKIP